MDKNNEKWFCFFSPEKTFDERNIEKRIILPNSATLSVKNPDTNTSDPLDLGSCYDKAKLCYRTLLENYSPTDSKYGTIPDHHLEELVESVDSAIIANVERHVQEKPSSELFDKLIETIQDKSIPLNEKIPLIRDSSKELEDLNDKVLYPISAIQHFDFIVLHEALINSKAKFPSSLSIVSSFHDCYFRAVEKKQLIALQNSNLTAAATSIKKSKAQKRYMFIIKLWKNSNLEPRPFSINNQFIQQIHNYSKDIGLTKLSDTGASEKIYRLLLEIRKTM